MGFNSKTIEHCQIFVGKVCTIFLPPINRNFTENQNIDHFALRVIEVNVDGVWGSNANNMVSFFPWDHIMLIQQELELDPNNPEDAKILNNFNKPAPQPPVEEKPFVDIRKLSRLAEDTKKAHDALDNFKKKSQ